MKNVKFKQCPTKKCETICGFVDRVDEGLHICPLCGKENKLNNWIKSTENRYNKQNKLRKGGKFYK